jgi:TonB family protein
MLPHATAELAPVHREHAVRVVVGRLVSLAEAEVNPDHASVTTPARRMTTANGEFILFISVRNEGTAPLLMRESEGLFDTVAPNLDDVADWGMGAESVAAATSSGPQYKRNDKPTYPRIAREREHEGKVVLKVNVLANGKVGEVILQESSGYKVLDRSAIGAVKRWQFHPAKKSGSPTDHWTIITVEFRLVEG